MPKGADHASITAPTSQPVNRGESDHAAYVLIGYPSGQAGKGCGRRWTMGSSPQKRYHRGGVM
jgi:hypothetical protein